MLVRTSTLSKSVTYCFWFQYLSINLLKCCCCWNGHPELYLYTWYLILLSTYIITWFKYVFCTLLSAKCTSIIWMDNTVIIIINEPPLKLSFVCDCIPWLAYPWSRSFALPTVGVQFLVLFRQQPRFHGVHLPFFHLHLLPRVTQQHADLSGIWTVTE